MMDMNIGDLKVNQIMLLSPHLLTDAILGLDFLAEYQAVIDFEEHSVTLNSNGERTKFKFTGSKKSTDELNCVDEASKELSRNFGFVSVFPRKQQYPTAERGQHHTDPIVTASGVALVVNERKGASSSEPHQQQRSKDKINLSIPRRKGNRDEYGEFISEYYDKCRNSQLSELGTLARDKEDHSGDNCGATEHKTGGECEESTTYVASRGELGLTTTYSEANVIGDHVNQKGLNTRQEMTDNRIITAEQLRGKLSENNLSTHQREKLYYVLAKYQQHLTKRPGRCNKFEYEFKIEGITPTSANSRPIPLVLREQVREQICCKTTF
jgi:hypothetical protein